MTKLINIAIAEDYSLFRQGISALLNEQPGIQVIMEAENGKDLLDKLRLQQPDIILMDIRMPIIDGHQALDIIRSKFRDIKVIILSMHYSETYISEFIAAGAAAFLPKNCEIEKIVETIQTVHKHGYAYDHRVSKSIAGELIKTKKTDSQATHFHLTDREIDIIRLLCDDKTLSEIATGLHISVRTVEWHKKNIFEKIGAKSLAGLTVYAIRQGIVPNPEDLFN